MQQPISRRVSLNISLDTNQKKRYDIKIRDVKNIGYNNNPYPKTGKYQVQGANKNSLPHLLVYFPIVNSRRKDGRENNDRNVNVFRSNVFRAKIG
jgi:hypothetical protein